MLELPGAWGICLGQATTGSNAALLAFGLYTLAVFVLAWAANRLLQGRQFLSEYFLGSRGLGMWAFALTFAATSASGGSFTGFPSLIYTHGWILALWIASYMVAPICTMGLLGKRINQIARKTGAITVPDVLRDRFDSRALGLLAMLLIVFFMSVNLVAQFKAGALILRTLLGDVPVFGASADWVASWSTDVPLFSAADPGYLICLLAFAAAVIFYTTYGGFHAVVWTDVMQGVIMVVGVMIMLPLALSQVGGLESATERLSRMTPPRRGEARLEIDAPAEQHVAIRSGTWVRVKDAPGEPPRYVRTGRRAVIAAGDIHSSDIPVLELTSREQLVEVEAQLAEAAARPVRASLETMDDYVYGADRPGVYVSGPGPGVGENESLGFLPMSVAISFFFMWAISGAGQPASMVRLMAFRNSLTLSRAIFTVSIYYSLIYFPLVIIFTCGRLILPGMELESDRIMPAIAVELTSNAGWPWLAGLLIAAPFAAIMSTVDSFLLMISSALVRDVYQRNLNPRARERTIKLLSYGCTLVVGLAAMFGAVNPPEFLQAIIVYCGSGLAACFLVPVALGLYWPRITALGAISGMLAGFWAHLSLYLVGLWTYEQFRPVRPWGIDPIIWGLLASLATVIFATRLGPAPPAWLVRRYFHRDAA